MIKFLTIQYKLGRITDEQLKSIINKTITLEQYEKIKGECE